MPQALNCLPLQIHHSNQYLLQFIRPLKKPVHIIATLWNIMRESETMK
jgi:hypothetical protein